MDKIPEPTSSSKEGKSRMPSWIRGKETPSDDIPLSDIPPAVSRKQIEESLTRGITNSSDESKIYGDVGGDVKVALKWLNQNRDALQANPDANYHYIKMAEEWYYERTEKTSDSNTLKNASKGLLVEIQRGANALNFNGDNR